MTKRQLIICLVVESCLLVAFAVTIAVLLHSLAYYRIDKDKLELKIEATHHVQGSTGADGISVTLTNNNNISVAVSRWEQYSDLHLEIRSASGVSVPLTEGGRHAAEAGMMGSRFGRHYINPREMENWGVSLAQLSDYFLLTPGTYSVRASTDVMTKDGDVWTQSNSEPLVIVK